MQYANELGLDWIWDRVQSLAATLRAQLSEVPGVQVHDKGKVLCGIVSFTKVCFSSLALLTSTCQALSLTDAFNLTDVSSGLCMYIRYCPVCSTRSLMLECVLPTLSSMVPSANKL